VLIAIERLAEWEFIKQQWANFIVI
jgi:hypothetical protein